MKLKYLYLLFTLLFLLGCSDEADPSSEVKSSNIEDDKIAEESTDIETPDDDENGTACIGYEDTFIRNYNKEESTKIENHISSNEIRFDDMEIGIYTGNESNATFIQFSSFLEPSLENEIIFLDQVQKYIGYYSPCLDSTLGDRIIETIKESPVYQISTNDDFDFDIDNIEVEYSPATFAGGFGFTYVIRLKI